MDVLPARASPRILYVLGYSHSGSTVLNIALGAHPEVVAPGELTNLVHHAWMLDVYCSCGKRGSECEFWSEVRARWAALSGTDDLAGYLALQRRFERARYIPRVLYAIWRGDPRLQDFVRRTVCLYVAIAEVAGNASVIVDISKRPARAALLAWAVPLDLALVHMIRDARGVAWSEKQSREVDFGVGVQKPKLSRPVARTTVRWVLDTAMSSFVRKVAHVPECFVRYEDFVTSPAPVLNDIGRLLDLEFQTVGARLERGETLPVRHCIAGNRLRMEGSIRLRLDDAWKQRLTRRERRTIWAIGGWLLKRLGYLHE